MKRTVLILVLALLAVGSLGASINLLSYGNEGGGGGCMALCISGNVAYGAGLGLIGLVGAVAGGIVAAADSGRSGRRGWVWGLSIGVLLALAGPMVGTSLFSSPITQDEWLIELVPNCGLPLALAAATLVYGLLALARRKAKEAR